MRVTCHVCDVPTIIHAQVQNLYDLSLWSYLGTIVFYINVFGTIIYTNTVYTTQHTVVYYRVVYRSVS